MALRLLNRTAVSGLIGKLSFDGGETLARPVLDRMLDASGLGRARILCVAPGIGLGGCAIGVTENEAIRVVADSRLTNAGELRDELERDGHRFRHHADADVIAHAYERWGTRCLARLRGPFACAVWDATNRRLVLARDASGLRPMHYALLHGHGIVFASDIRALFQDPGVPREWCADGIDAYLTVGYIPAPLTAYRRVSKLEPAHLLTVEGRTFRVERFWNPATASRDAAPKHLASALAGGLKTSVRRELRNVSHGGLLYSGGLAATALLTATPPAMALPITVDLDHDPNELTRSDAAAAHLGHVRELETIERPVSTLVEDVTAAIGEPVGDPSALTEFAVCQAAARRTTVALSAHGASALWNGEAGRERLWDDRQRRAMYTRGFAWQVRDTNVYAQQADGRTAIADRVVPIAEHAAASAGLELRFPFLDRAHVELAIATPDAMKRRNVLRSVLEPHLPARLMPSACAARRSPPWLPAALAVLVPRMLLGPRFDGRGIISRLALRHLWDEHVAARVDHARRLWALVMLEYWFRESIDGDAAAEPLEYAVLLKAA